MTVRHILDTKGRDVLTATQTATVHDVARTLAEKKVGALVLLGPDGRLAGIVSERDVVRVIARSGVDSLSQTIDEVMTLKVTTCTQDTTVDEAMELMTNGRFRHLPVIENERVVGVVSIGDVVKQRIETVEREASEMRDYISAG
ncbi:CBS domain-containing protein [Aurantimonas sp. Leaf443]|uniref:CBS domain-containing protein n=1 Tax=Aurantimonas sp. Leaf443 TaxID=1736378 RepID=UPI000701ADA9|nr:CBS domain-containing protein [Aurantimonas sp. Leaf443]KQT86303.1 inosine-5-monophosphate dehydrogenase [Aurantimonas sp. Leaf443]